MMRVVAALLAPSLLALLPSAAIAASEGEMQQGHAQDAGIDVRWAYTPHDEAPGVGALDVWVSSGGLPIDYRQGAVAAWLQRRRPALSDAETSCAERVRGFARATPGRRAEIDLNTYRIVTLNTDGTIAFINPFVGINNAKLDAILTLPGPPLDWVAIPDRQEAWVLLGAPLRLARLDLATARITRLVELPDDPDAHNVAADAQAVLVPLPVRGQIARLPLSGAEASLEPEPAVTGLRVLPPGRVSLHADSRVRLGARAWSVDGRPTDAAWSTLGQRVVIGTDSGAILLADPASDALVRHASLSHAVRRLTLLDDGRRVVALGDGQASLVELATVRPPLALPVTPGADRIVVTERFVYAIDPAAGRATLWSAAELRAGHVVPVEVQLGRPTERNPVADGLSLALPAPDGTGLLYANPADGLIYQYGEGMMAPTGSYSNYRRAAIGLAIQDMSLRPLEPGHYRGTVRHARGGTYDLTIGGSSPRVSACSTLALAPLPGAPVEAGRLHAERVQSAPEDGPEIVRVRLREDGLEDRVAGLRDLVLLVFDRQDGWQRRLPMNETAPGEYRAAVTVPRLARYELMVSSPSANLSYVEGRAGSAELGPR